MRRPGPSSSCRHGSAALPTLLLLLLLLAASAQAQQARTRTDPVEADALKGVFDKIGREMWPSWFSSSVDPCTGAATDDTDTDIDHNPNLNPAIKCNCKYQNNTVCHITKLKMYALDLVGPIPEELRNLTHLTNLNLMQNYLTGPIPSFLGELTALQYLSLAINALSGSVPKELGKLVNLVSLGISINNLNGSLPPELGNMVKLEQLYIDSSGLSGPLPPSFSKLTSLKILWASDNDFTGQIPDYIGSLSNLSDLRFQGNSFQGPLPTTLSNLVQLTSLRIGDIVNGSSSLAFISNMTSLNTLVLRNCRISDNLASVNFSQFAKLSLLDLSFNNITGLVPQALLNLNSLSFLFLGNNSLSGSLPSSIGTSLKNLDFSYNQLSGNFPSWVSPNLTLNLVANNFVVSNSNNSVLLPSGLECLQRDTPCFLGSPQRAPTWGVSNVGRFMEAFERDYIIQSLNASYTVYSSTRLFRNTPDSELFQKARMSPSSLRYFGIGLENGNYVVTLQFAEISFEDSRTWKSLGKRVFDIYIQGERKEQNFDIRKEARGSYAAVQKQYIIPVTRNFLEIHLFWAGKGTCCIPSQGHYGPLISALSVTPAPNAARKRSKNKTGATVGAAVGAVVVGLIVLTGLYVRRQKSRKLSLEQQDLYNTVGRPNLFTYSYGELKTASENFNSSNFLGEGGYGSVYKGKLSDGSVVAVKLLSETSRQGKKQFITEIETISQVQHRNLVKLYGCCLEGNNPLLVYEYLDNGSLDKALFGNGRLNLDWPTRFEICLGIARGLAYLHEESSIRVVHRDIKASNVLLDANLNSKISDFGLAKLYDDKNTHISTKVAGTFGYLAPEYAMRGHMSEKVDVFAFGVVILETIAGRPNYDGRLGEDKAYLLEWVLLLWTLLWAEPTGGAASRRQQLRQVRRLICWIRWQEVWQLYEDDHPLDVTDPRLTEFNSEEVLRAIRVGLLCIQSSPRQRPPMSRVVSMLVGDIEVPEAVTKPSYVIEWQSNAMGTSSSEPGAEAMSLSSVIDEGR
ncbi:hypothetical protein SEVIR_7G248700v4 [Setaria viridis]